MVSACRGVAGLKQHGPQKSWKVWKKLKREQGRWLHGFSMSRCCWVETAWPTKIMESMEKIKAGRVNEQDFIGLRA